MPSSKIKPPSKYLYDWHLAMAWLGARSEGEIMLGEAHTDAAAQTLRQKAASMRGSIRMYPGWPYNVRVMVLDGELHFELRGRQVWAVRRREPRSIVEVLRDTHNILAKRG